MPTVEEQATAELSSIERKHLRRIQELESELFVLAWMLFGSALFKGVWRVRSQQESQQKEYERLDRHVRTSATVLELMRWDEIRIKSSLKRSHHLALRKQIAKRLRKLTEVKR